MNLCTFCLDEPAPCPHPSCPQGSALPTALQHLTPRTPTRPSLAGQSPTPVPIADSRPVPHIGTRPSLQPQAPAPTTRGAQNPGRGDP